MRKTFPGTLFLVVGNSGSGKDSIISSITNNYPKELKKIYVPKRYITRPPSETENNISITREEFKQMESKGKFALKWHIYDLDYGVPIDIEDRLKDGNPVVVNVSRTIIKEARKLYSNLKIVFIHVPLELTIKRLKERGREKSNSLEKRIERAKKFQFFPEADFVIDNSGDISRAIDQFIEYIVPVVK